MDQQLEKWKLNSQYFIRDKYFNLYKKLGNQALRQQDQLHFKRQRIFRNTSFKDREKLPPMEQSSKKCDYSLPEFIYPTVHQVSTIDEYNKILQARIRSNEKKERNEWKLPPLQNEYKEKYQLKRTISQADLKIKLEQIF
ncbi:unnamed protein product (macronuclear) [Paramecium tetraurelia]|uniref:Uncharacterized protein n=1 Tax=Paramecium tetraurelia TaxID=5888 RepID=A0E940_PARTE|nr:uncharacterized protein GSPATT00024538001 [Paramecium tetraurelia]CAK91807.1 unnamed protein product [Paramecium tetraurelia]|eukprot:XP_001459204.1 hypothetical protein (macronuclear) [Paramecium tetraurelia strain d4-2]